MKNTSLCWYCLQELKMDHECEKVFKKITIPKPKYEKDKQKNINEFDKYIFTKENKEHINMSNILKIKLTPHFLWVNNFFTKIIDTITLEDIAEAVFISTRKKSHSNLYKIIEIDIDMVEDEDTPDELIEYIENELHDLLPERIFKKNFEVEYIFIC